MAFYFGNFLKNIERILLVWPVRYLKFAQLRGRFNGLFRYKTTVALCRTLVDANDVTV